jgi:isopenicillin N synthase-like dioxygenase/alkylated DNA repair dioxygenase AlkB
MSVALSTSQILAAAKAKAQNPQVAPLSQEADAAAPKGDVVQAERVLTAEEAAELAAYLPQRFTPSADALTSAVPHPLEHYRLTKTATGAPLPPAVYVVPDFVSVDEEAQLLSLVGSSPAASWTMLKRRSLQMWGGTPATAADPDAEFVPSPLPAWQEQLIDRLVSTGVSPSAKALRPNHVLLNRYEQGQGILAHKDGPLYAPQVAILSLHSHTVMDFFARLADSLPGAQYVPAFSVFLPPRSLLLFSEQLYSNYFHAIAERDEDELDPRRVLGLPESTSGTTTVLQRSTRISLTIRRVHTRAERMQAQQRESATGVTVAHSTAAAAAAAPASSSSSSASSSTASTASPLLSDDHEVSTAYSVPVIDIGPLLSDNDAEGRLRVSREIFAACTGDGFFYISNHGVSLELQQDLERLTRAFFALPLESKMRISMERGGSAWRGYFPCFGELTSGKPDIKEGLYLGTELTDDHPLVQANTPMHGSNLFPDEELPELRPTVLAYLSALTELAHRLLEGVALGLGLDAQHFRSNYTQDPTVLFRLFNYPEHASHARDETSYGVGEHTDYGVLTILKQDDSGGLQVKSPSHGCWIAAPPLENTFVVNIGDMLERLTGGRFQSTPHRVRNLAPRDRISAPFFFDPSWHSRVTPLPLDHLPPATNVSDSRKTRWDKSSVFDFEGQLGEG